MAMKKSLTVALAGLTALGLGVGGARAQGPEGGRLPGGPEADRPQGEEAAEGFLMGLATRPEVAKQLGLTEEQVRTLRDGLYDSRMKGIDLRAALEKSAMEQAKLLMEPQVDEKALMALIEKSGSIRTDLAKERIRPLLLAKKTLTPEQIQKAKDMVREHARREGRDGGEWLRDRMERRRQTEPWGAGRGDGEMRRRQEAAGGERGAERGRGEEAPNPAAPAAR
jgi:Spy/CpxP family protein refolding chaperone